MRLLKVVGLLFLIIVMVACSNQTNAQPINSGSDVCEVTGQRITNEGFATQLISKDGEVFKFEEIGCMMQYIMKNKGIAENEIEIQYVRDSYTGEWVELQDAYYAYHPDFWTPMAHGVLSFKDKESAQRYIKDQGIGMLMGYEGLHQLKWSWK